MVNRLLRDAKARRILAACGLALDAQSKAAEKK